MHYTGLYSFATILVIVISVMRDSLERLYETKLVLLATLFTLGGLTMMVAERAAPSVPSLAWLQGLPVGDVGSTLFTTGLVAVLLNYLDGRDSEERASRRLRRILGEQTPAMRDAVIEGFAVKPEDLARVTSPAVLDQVTRNALAIQLVDAQFASEVFDDLREQAIGAGERRYDLETTIDLSVYTERDATVGSVPLFAVTVTREYTLVPTDNVWRFTSVGDADEYRELAGEGSGQVWRFRAVAGLTAEDQAAFELVQFAVNGEARAIKRTARAGSQTYTATLGRSIVDQAEPVRVSYAYRTVVRQDGHLYRMSIGKPTKGVKIHFRCGDTGISNVDVVSFLASSKRTRITQEPDGWPQPYSLIEFDGWAFPRSGVAFTWRLERETAQEIASR